MTHNLQCVRIDSAHAKCGVETDLQMRYNDNDKKPRLKEVMAFLGEMLYFHRQP